MKLTTKLIILLIICLSSLFSESSCITRKRKTHRKGIFDCFGGTCHKKKKEEDPEPTPKKISEYTKEDIIAEFKPECN